MNTGARAAKEIVRKSYIESITDRLESLPRGYETRFEAGGREYMIMRHRIADWYGLTQETIDSMGKYIHDFIAKNTQRSCNLRGYGGSGPVFLPKDVLASAMTEKMLRSKEGKAQVERTLENMVSADAKIKDDAGKEAARIARESLILG